MLLSQNQYSFAQIKKNHTWTNYTMLTTSTFLTIPQVILTIQFINMTWPEEFVLIFLKFQKLISSSKWDWICSYHSNC